ncbi:MAG TPA: alkaline phosphatase D family protein [Aggregatilineales bacterium]|nr:alkaline phosphatase D family protein [Aggregatilineales bacterium]
MRTITLLCLIFVVFPLSAAQPDTLPNGIASGDTTQTSTVLWTRSTTPGIVTFEVLLDDEVIAVQQVEVTDAMLPVKVQITDLTPGTTYTYRVTDAVGSVLEGHFRTPAAVGITTGLHFGVSGDWRGELRPYPSVRNAAEKNLDFFVMLGDTIYADFPTDAVPAAQASTLEEYRAKHAEVYEWHLGMNTLADIRASTSIFAVIDDHEVTNDFAGGAASTTHPLFADDPADIINDAAIFEAGLQAFQEYNPLRDEFYGDTGDPRTSEERRLYRYQTFGSDAAIFLLDNRSFRDEELPGVQDFTSPTEILLFLNNTFQEGRTMLGQAQLEALQRDLLDAQQQDITWKFVLVPEPIQNLGVVGSPDRFEGYAAERRDLLKFIDENDITNVVFICADIHGMVVNNLVYQNAPLDTPIPLDSFEISTGAVAYFEPLGPTVMGAAHNLGAIDDDRFALYKHGTTQEREALLLEIFAVQLQTLRLPLPGLEDSPVDAELIQGSYMATQTYGWSEFEIDAETQNLRIITYGIEYYGVNDLSTDPEAILNRQPEIVSEFVVTPK